MIGWLHGERLDNWKQSQKQGIVLACSGVGYEVQLLPRHHLLIASVEKVTLWVHQIKRDDGESLYGFKTKEERNLFRILIAVNGVGPQIAMSLLEDNEINDLVKAIIDEDAYELTARLRSRSSAETWLYDLSKDMWTHVDSARLPLGLGMNYNLEYDPGHNILLLVARDEKYRTTV